MRLLSIFFIGLSVFIALKPTFIVTLMALSWGTVAGSFLAVYVYGLFWDGITKAGAWAGVLSGLAISVGFSFYYKLDGSLIPTIGAAAMVVPLVIVPIVSVLTPKFSEEHLQKVYGEGRKENDFRVEGLVIDDLG